VIKLTPTKYFALGLLGFVAIKLLIRQKDVNLMADSTYTASTSTSTTSQVLNPNI